VVIVEDDNELRENFCDHLEDQGFKVISFTNKQAAEEYFHENIPDLALLDIGLPGNVDGGYELCRQLRRKSDAIPIIIITAHDTDIDKISGMRLGADDYISKMESFEYIMVRIKALLRRIDVLSNSNENKDDILIRGSLLINRSRYEVIWKESNIKLPLAEYWMVNLLAERPGAIKSTDQLMNVSKSTVTPNTIAVRINAIRNKFKAIDAGFDLIENERGVGYRWRTE